MGNLFTEEVGKVLTRLLGNYLTEALGKVLDIYTCIIVFKEVIKDRNLFP